MPNGHQNKQHNLNFKLCTLVLSPPGHHLQDNAAGVPIIKPETCYRFHKVIQGNRAFLSYAIWLTKATFTHHHCYYVLLWDVAPAAGFQFNSEFKSFIIDFYFFFICRYLDFVRWTLVMEFSTCWVSRDFESLYEKKIRPSNCLFFVNSFGFNIKSFGWLKYSWMFLWIDTEN